MDYANGFGEHPSVDTRNPRKRKRRNSATGDQVFKRPAFRSPTWISTTHNAPSFYDLLPRIELTRRALQEFDRRQSLTSKPAPPNAAILAEDLRKSLPSSQTDVSADLQRFARTGGADLSHLRGYPLPSSIEMAKTRNSSHASTQMSAMPPPRSKGKMSKHRVEPSDETNKTGKTGKTSAYNDNFITILAERNIRRPRHTPRPTNYDELRTLLEQSRSCLSPSNFSDQDHDKFLEAVDNARTEPTVMSFVFPLILGETRYPSTMNKPCTNWAPIVADAELVTPQPDYYDGIRAGPENKLLRQHYNKIIVPAADAPFLPNFFAEAKAPRGSIDIAVRQAMYHGAFGARAMHYTRNSGSSNDFDSKSYTFTATYASGFLSLYAHFLTQADGPTNSACYHMSPLGSWALENSVDSFQKGVTAFRNLRDLAHKMRTELADVTTQKLRALDLSGQLPPPPNIGPDSTAERDESQTSASTLPPVIDSGSQELAPLKTRRQRKPKQQKPIRKPRTKTAKARLRAKAKAK